MLSHATVASYCWQPGALTAALNWYRGNFRPEVFGQTQVRSMPKLHLPVFGVWSDGDTALTEEQMTASQQYVAEGLWQYARLEGAGHWIPRDAGQRLTSLLTGFWESPMVARSAATGHDGSGKRSKL
jgi:pimeloyl-ACP methyl ester carboxylesterase